MSFTNFMRESDDRSIGHRPMQGWVVQNNDTKKVNPDGTKGPGGNQQIQVRVHDLHDDTPDEDLPWFSPEQLSAYSGAADIGHHGPVPQVGTKVWIKFGDDSQYHGTYGGGVANKPNQIPQFTGQGKPVKLPDGTPYNFATNYPAVNGHVNGSGTFRGIDETTDVTHHNHVSGTAIATDGKGNVSHVVNGDAPRPDNPNAKKIFGKGYSMVVFGDINMYASGKIIITSIGDCDISTNGSANIVSQGTCNVTSAGTLNLSGNQINIESGSGVDINSTSPQSATTVTAKSAPQPLSRPNNQFTANDDQSNDF